VLPFCAFLYNRDSNRKRVHLTGHALVVREQVLVLQPLVALREEGQ
jgi:hypothetical protein